MCVNNIEAYINVPSKQVNFIWFPNYNLTNFMQFPSSVCLLLNTSDLWLSSTVFRDSRESCNAEKKANNIIQMSFR